MASRDDFSTQTKRRLADRAGNICSICGIPTSGAKLDNEEEAINAGVACHISAAARGAWAKRSREMDAALALAFAQALPVRVIICAGKMGNVIVDPANSSKVSRRLLDPIPWAVTSYDNKSGECVVTRGAEPTAVIDQFSAPGSDTTPLGRTVTGQVIVRDSAVRSKVLVRASGFCELCSQPGFTTAKGAAYLETHHIIPLADDGPDKEFNVTALCPNDHRRAHHGRERDALRTQLQLLVAAKLKVAK